MRPVEYMLTGSPLNGAPIVIDRHIAPTNIGIGVDVTGTITYTVQHTFDNVFDPNVTPLWFNHPVLSAQLADGDGNYASPPFAVRLITTAGTGSARIRLLQAGAPGGD